MSESVAYSNRRIVKPALCGYEFIVYAMKKPNSYHDEVGVYAKSVAPTGASYTYFVGETIGE